MFFSNAPQHRDTMMLLLPYRAGFTFWLSPKSKQKAQGCVRFARKSYAITTKNPELPPIHWSLLKQQDFFNVVIACFPAHRPRPSLQIRFLHTPLIKPKSITSGKEKPIH